VPAQVNHLKNLVVLNPRRKRGLMTRPLIQQLNNVPLSSTSKLSLPLRAEVTTGNGFARRIYWAFFAQGASAAG
jgi:hypothetical protein